MVVRSTVLYITTAAVATTNVTLSKTQGQALKAFTVGDLSSRELRGLTVALTIIDGVSVNKFKEVYPHHYESINASMKTLKGQFVEVNRPSL